MALLSDDRLKDPDTKGFSQVKVGPLYLQVSRSDRRKAIPQSVELMLASFGATQAASSRRVERC